MEEKLKKPKTYYKTLDILKNYNKIKKSIQFLKNKLKDLEFEKSELPKSVIKSNKVVLKEADNNYYYTDETLENDINETKQLIIKTQKHVDFIDSCINELKGEQYFDIIDLFYKKNENVAFVTLKLNISEATFYRVRDNLVFKLSYILFANEKITEDLTNST